MLIRLYGDSMFVLWAVAGLQVVSDATIWASTAETAAVVRSAACDAQLIHVPRERNSDADRGVGAALDLRASADSDEVGVALMNVQGGGWSRLWRHCLGEGRDRPSGGTWTTMWRGFLTATCTCRRWRALRR